MDPITLILTGIISGGLGFGGSLLGNVFRKDTTLAQIQSQEKIEFAQLQLSYEQLAWDKIAMFMSLMQNSGNSGGRNNNLPLLLYMMGAFGATSPSASSGSSDGSKDSAQNISDSNSTINQPVNSYLQNTEIIRIQSDYNTVNSTWLNEHSYMSASQIDQAINKTVPVWETKVDQITTYVNTVNPQEGRKDSITHDVMSGDVSRYLAWKNW